MNIIIIIWLVGLVCSFVCMWIDEKRGRIDAGLKKQIFSSLLPSFVFILTSPISILFLVKIIFEEIIRLYIRIRLRIVERRIKKQLKKLDKKALGIVQVFMKKLDEAAEERNKNE